MAARLDNLGNVAAWCERDQAITTFERTLGGTPYGSHGWHAVVAEDGQHQYNVMYMLLCCSGCKRGAVAELRSESARTPNSPTPAEGVTLVDFNPSSVQSVPLPVGTPQGVAAEFREAERCASVGAFRAASAMLRSALEKALSLNGYDSGTLYSKIENAANDGIVTESRRRQAHDNVRALGNDVVHEEWRQVHDTEFELAQRYTQRVIEDFYEGRESVVKILTEKGRQITEEPAASAEDLAS